MSMIPVTADDWAELSATVKRSKPSPYTADLDKAKVGDAFAVQIPTGEGAVSARTIVANLHKAARELDKPIQVLVRGERVAWRVLEGNAYVAPPTRNRTPKTDA